MKYLFNKLTHSAYLPIYNTPVNHAVPDNGEQLVLLQCRLKQMFYKGGDQQFVTLPKHLVDDFFTNDAGITVNRSELIEG